MPILASLLYGSRARGDNSANSDVDVLMITDDGMISHNNLGNLSVSFYPFEDLVQRAIRGDLYLCHVLREGKLLYNSGGVVDELNSKFKLRDSYENEKNQAADIAWLIVKFANDLRSSPLLGRRLAWCVRTILISSSAENGKPVFSAHELAQLAPQHNILELIAQKEGHVVAASIVNDLMQFLLNWKLPDRLPKAREIVDYAEWFADTKNTMGMNLLKIGRELEVGYI